MAKLYIGNTAYKVMLGNNGGHFLNQKPYDYQVEYLESTGTQWIDTGFIANNGMILDAKVKAVNEQMMIGSLNATADYSRNLVSYATNGYTPQKLSNYRHTYIDSGINPVIIYLDTTEKNFYCTINNNLVVDTTTTGTLRNQTVTVKISYSNYSSSVRSGRYYYAKIYNSNNVLVRDLIPVVDKQGVGCMYDKISGKLFYNQGTGNFVVGPRVDA